MTQRQTRLGLPGRPRMAYYSGAEQTEGGGQDNILVVDYRLGVVLGRVGYQGRSIHRWRWS